MRSRAPVFLAAVTAASGCARGQAAAPEIDRADWLRQRILENERPALARDAELVAGKLARMARTKFSFFRGTAWLVPPAPSRFATPAASQVAVLGDPHPENVGSFTGARGDRRLEFNDFDLAGHGSFLDDLRRLALGLWIVTDMADLKTKQRVKVVEDLASGYLSELRGLAEGKPPTVLTGDLLPGDLDEILAPADDEDATKEPRASAEEAALAAAVLAAYPASLAPGGAPPPPGAFAIKRVVRRHAGVSSFPVLRLQVVVEGPTPSPDDDWTLELKESVGRPAAQQVALQRQFQETPALDPLLGWAAVGARQFRVRQVLPANRRLDAERIARQVKSPRWGKRDLKDLSSSLGRLLARGHARAPGRDGKPGLAPITAAITSDDGLREELVAHAQAHAIRNEADLHLFRKLLARHGPLLGWTAR